MKNLNKNTVIGWDVDGTLITYDDKPNYPVIQLFKMFEALGCKNVIFSGGGISYAEMWANKLGLTAEIRAKGNSHDEYAIVFDDSIDPVVGTEQGHQMRISTKVFINVGND
jgi:hydroxymethylpyrimidine pyrophosphatase-like HAD family hydrolase